MPKKSTSRLNYYQKMLMTYILSAMIFFSICYSLLAGYFFYHAVRENQKASTLAVQQMQKDLDNQFTSLENIYLRIRTNSDLVQALMCQSPYEQYRTAATFASYCSLNSGLVDLAVFDYQHNIVQSAYGVSTPEEYFHKMLIATNSEDCEAAVRLTDNRGLSGFYPVRLYNRNTSSDVALYVMSISETRKLMFAMDKSRLLKPIEGLVGTSATTFIITENAELQSRYLEYDINGGAPLPLSEMENLDYKIENGLYTATHDGQIAVSTYSSETGFYYCVVSDVGSFWNLNFLFVPLIVCVLTIGLSGVFVAILLARRVYQPIQQLQDYVTGNIQGYGYPRKCEFTQIRAAVDQLRHHASLSEKDRELLRTSMLSALTFSPFFYQHYSDFYQEANIAFPHLIVQVAVARLTAIEEGKAVLSTLCAECGVNWYTLDTEDSITILLNSPDAESAEMVLERFVEKFQSLPSFHIGISGTHHGAEKIWIGTMQAFAACEWCEEQNEPLCFYKKQQNNMSLALARFYKLQPAFLQAVRDCKLGDAEKYLREILSVSPGKELRTFLYNSLLSQLTTFSRSDIRQSESFLTAIQQSGGVREQMLQNLLMVVQEICAPAANETSDELMRMLESYIRENYTDCNLSAQSVAEHFAVSNSYISKYVKKFTDKTLFALIDEQRMACAQKLLSTTELPIKEIVARSGYVDVNNFVKKFKAATGYTPTLYRQTCAAQTEPS